MMTKAKALTEADWLACTSPDRMLRHLRQHARISRTPGGSRCLRLFAVACCRRVWPLLPEERSRAAVETAERYADGRASRAELAAACEAAREVERIAEHQMQHIREGNPLPAEAEWVPVHRARLLAAGPVWASQTRLLARAAELAAGLIAGAVSTAGAQGRAEAMARRQAEDAAQSGLIRDIFGSPFRQPPHLEPAWLAWHRGAVMSLAQAAYDNRQLSAGLLDNARLAVLADALEEAGCADPALLGHLRSGGEHVRGCFVIDSLLGRH
jgi:hypothetical protein